MSQGIVRRRDKIMSEAEVSALLARAPVAHFASVSANGDPYVIPNLFVHDAGTILCHTATSGHFRANVLAHPRLCFEIAEMGTVFPYGRFECDSSVSYQSVVGFGPVRIETDTAAKTRFFDLLMRKYSTTQGRPASFYPRLDQTTFYVLTIERLTGKHQALPGVDQLWPAQDLTKTPGAVPP